MLSTKHARITGKTKGSARPAGRTLCVEFLEDRLLLYNIGATPWAETNLSFSLVPDGSSYRDSSSVLFGQLDAIAPRELWQREFARALQTWANHSNLNFHLSPDDGAWNGIQGTIRLASIPHNSGIACASYPSPSFYGGDIILNASASFAIGGVKDLYTTLVHESGHSLGLAHTLAESSAMRAFQGRPLPGGVGPDDIAGIQALYGARQPDAFDAAAANDSFARATALQPADPNGAVYSADLTSHEDIDYYRTTIPAGTTKLTVAVNARELSLLAPKVAVYDQLQKLVAVATGEYGTVASVEIPVTPGQTYTLVADGATNDEFGIGAYRLNVQFTHDQTQPIPETIEPPLPPETPPPVDSDNSNSPATEPDQGQNTADPPDPVVPPADTGNTTPTVNPPTPGDDSSGSTPQTGGDSQHGQTAQPESGLLVIRVTRRRLLASGGADAARNDSPATPQPEPANAEPARTPASLSTQLASSAPAAAAVETDSAGSELPDNSQDASNAVEILAHDAMPDPPPADDPGVALAQRLDIESVAETNPVPPAALALTVAPQPAENTAEPSAQQVIIRVTRRGTTISTPLAPPIGSSAETASSGAQSPADTVAASTSDPVATQQANSETTPASANVAGPVVETNPADSPLPAPTESPVAEAVVLPRRRATLLLASAAGSSAAHESPSPHRLQPNLVNLAIQGI